LHYTRLERFAKKKYSSFLGPLMLGEYGPGSYSQLFIFFGTC
jgi:hypothetical protein